MSLVVEYSDMKRKRYGRVQPPDIGGDLGLGDPGFRLRPGRTGFDPFEQTVDQARFEGILLASLLRPHLRMRLVAAAVLVAVVAYIFGEGWAALLVAAAGVGSVTLWTGGRVASYLREPPRRY